MKLIAVAALIFWLLFQSTICSHKNENFRCISLKSNRIHIFYIWFLWGNVWQQFDAFCQIKVCFWRNVENWNKDKKRHSSSRLLLSQHTFCVESNKKLCECLFRVSKTIFMRSYIPFRYCTAMKLLNLSMWYYIRSLFNQK